MPNGPGDYLATVEGWGLRQSKTSASAGIDLTCSPNSLWLPEEREWTTHIDISPIYATVWLLNKSGDILSKATENLKAALKWDGDLREFMTVADGGTGRDFAGSIVRLVCENEEYNGKISLRVRYVNPPSGQVREVLSKPVIDSILSRWDKAVAAAGQPKLVSSEVPLSDEPPDDEPPF